MTSKRFSFDTLSLEELDAAPGGTWLLDQYLDGRSDDVRQMTIEWLNQWGYDESNMDGIVGFWFQIEGRAVPQQPAPEPPAAPPPAPERHHEAPVVELGYGADAWGGGAQY